MKRALLTLTARELADAFPFHFAVDRQWRVVQVGRNLPRICPGLAIGARAVDAMRLARPRVEFSWEGVARHLGALFLVECIGTGVQLRGQLLVLEQGEAMMFLGSPWFTSADDLLDAGLGLEDFAIHDPGTDMLLVMQAQRAALAELKQLAGRLTRQRSELREANTRLLSQNEELKSARDAVARSEADARLLGLVAARTDNGVVITDAEGRIVWVNEGFSRMTGYVLDEVRGRTPGSILQGADTDPDTVNYMRRRLREQQGFTAEVLNYHRNGRPYWLAIEVQPVRSPEGHLTHYLAIETDITARRKADEALRAETELLGTTLASIVDGVVVVDRQRRVQLLNPAAEALTGWTLAEAEGRDVGDIFALRDAEGSPAPDLLGDSFERRTEVGDIHGTEPHWVLTARDGKARLVVASARPMLREGATIVGGLIAFRDVSAEIEADEMKRDFVFAVSHELRTPLTSIRGFLATLLGDPGIPPDLRREFLQIASDQALRLGRLVEDILEISRIEAGQAQFEHEAIKLVDMAQRSLQEIVPLAARKHLRVEAQLAPDLPPVFGDPDRLRSVFTNLLSNAVKFTPDGGLIALELRRDGAEAVISVRDTGIGIPAEHQQRIFQKFYRVRRPGQQVAGTGLGLSIVHSVVERMGGTITVESAPEQGTRFIVRLPTAPNADRPPAPA